MINQSYDNDLKKENESLYLTNYINEMINKNVYVKLNDDSEFNGKLISFDTSFNLVIENCNQIKSLSINKSNNVKFMKNLKETFIRGNNVSYISLES